MTKNPAQIVAFPFPKREVETLVDTNPREAVFQLKLEAAQMLNEVAQGTYTLNGANRRGIERINRLCLEYGLTPLEFVEQQRSN